MRRCCLLIAVSVGCGGEDAGPGASPDGGPKTDGPPIGVEDVWGFTEVAAASGITFRHHLVGEGAFEPNFYDHGAGLAAGDFDGDGHEDLLALDQCGPTGYYLGNGDGTFRDASERMAPLNGGVRVGVTYGDYDNDGDVDFYVTFTRRPNMLLRQEADGTFTDVAREAGVAVSGHLTGAVFADFDGDGRLDLAVAATGPYTGEEELREPGCVPYHDGVDLSELGVQTAEPSYLFMSRGAADEPRFEDEGAARGIPRPSLALAGGWFGDATAADFDRDGDVDLLMTDMFGTSQILANDGAGYFTNIVGGALPRTSYGIVATTVEDYDNDGRADLLMTDMHSDMWIRAEEGFGDVRPHERYRDRTGPAAGAGDNREGPIFGNSLWLGRPGGRFEEVGVAWEVETFQPWGHVPADFDNDGLVDVYIPSGMSNPYEYWPDAFLHNQGDRFVQRQAELGFDPPPWGAYDDSQRIFGQPYVSAARAATVADFDEDGDLDLAVLVWDHPLALYRNDLPPGNHWLSVRLVGRQPRDPYGAWVEVRAGDRTYARWARGAHGYLSQGTSWVHFGLGAATAVDEVTVRWPGGGTTTVEAPAIDSRITIEQE